VKSFTTYTRQLFLQS